MVVDLSYVGSRGIQRPMLWIAGFCPGSVRPDQWARRSAAGPSRNEAALRLTERERGFPTRSRFPNPLLDNESKAGKGFSARDNGPAVLRTVTVGPCRYSRCRSTKSILGCDNLQNMAIPCP